MVGSVNATLWYLVPVCDCGPLSLDHVVGSHSNGSSMTAYGFLEHKHIPRRVAYLELVLDIHKSSVNFHPVPFYGVNKICCLTIQWCS